MMVVEDVVDFAVESGLKSVVELVMTFEPFESS